MSLVCVRAASPLLLGLALHTPRLPLASVRTQRSLISLRISLRISLISLPIESVPMHTDASFPYVFPDVHVWVCVCSRACVCAMYTGTKC